jgi:hypothetical protein
MQQYAVAETPADPAAAFPGICCRQLACGDVFEQYQ